MLNTGLGGTLRFIFRMLLFNGKPLCSVFDPLMLAGLGLITCTADWCKNTAVFYESMIFGMIMCHAMYYK